MGGEEAADREGRGGEADGEVRGRRVEEDLGW